MVVVETDSYPADGPLLWYVRRLAESHGLAVHPAPAGGRPTGRPIVVGHGPASTWSAWAAAHDLPVVFFSPYLDIAEVAGSLTALRGPGLAVGAVGDPHWDRVTAARLTSLEVLQLPGADHLLEVPGDPLASIQVITRVVERCRALLERLRA
jgi:hypothetical protein